MRRGMEYWWSPPSNGLFSKTRKSFPFSKKQSYSELSAKFLSKSWLSTETQSGLQEACLMPQQTAVFGGGPTAVAPRFVTAEEAQHTFGMGKAVSWWLAGCKLHWFNFECTCWEYAAEWASFGLWGIKLSQSSVCCCNMCFSLEQDITPFKDVTPHADMHVRGAVTAWVRKGQTEHW